MTDEQLLARSRALLIHEACFWGQGSSGASVLRLPGVVASVAPTAPDRSMFNWVVPDDASALTAAYEHVTRAYGDAGVRAFTVWVPASDLESVALLSDRGHVLDSKSSAMAAPMDAITLEEPGDLEWSETRDLALVAGLNDRAYGFPPPAFSEALTRWPAEPGWRGFLARLNGHAVACAMTFEAPSGDCGVTGVASLPEARGRRLATRLLCRALAAAKARGATSTSLQASPMGRSMYAKLGYRDLGELEMWERRVPRP